MSVKIDESFHMCQRTKAKLRVLFQLSVPFQPAGAISEMSVGLRVIV
jgi:hypothetical protein